MRAVYRLTLKGSVAAVAILGWSACTGEDAGSETAYVERLGGDTLAVEVVRRSVGRIEGEVIVRSPVTRYITYSVALEETGRVTRFETEHMTPEENPEGPERRHAIVTMDGSTATVIRQTGEAVDTAEVALDGLTIPSTGRAPMPTGILEIALSHLDASGGAEALQFQLLAPWGSPPRATPNTLTDRGGSEYELDFFGSPMVVSVDAAGHVVGVSGAQTTMKIEVEPLALPDMQALASDYAARDARGEGLGAPSPPATVEASGGGATFEVRYSRPAMRGRQIWGGLVPYGEVWRTGANAATHFTTDRDVTIGDLEVPAGTYTLWSTYTAEGGILIVNSQTQIWGTAYDAAHDLGRTALSHEELAEPVQRFTISIASEDAGGVLSLEWDTSRYTVPIRVR